MDEALRELVRRRANYLCEYCHLPEAAAPFVTLHVEHVRAKQHHGGDDELNLALACPDCNFKKGPNVATVSQETGQVVPLFNPRTDSWDEHFAMVGLEIVGLTPIGQATVSLLDMNDDERIVVRAELKAEGLF
jgi:hypothetical protein